MMVRARIPVYLLIAIGLGAAPAVAGDSATPRTPIGPRVMEMAPASIVLNLPPSPGDVRIRNPGPYTLAFSYWNGQSAWQTLSIQPKQSIDFSCAKCGETVLVSYHDGKENKTTKATTGRTYLFWPGQANAWVLVLASSASQ
jgi:hypothetical protein